MNGWPDVPARILAPAKINLHLAVGPRRADGYHPVCSLMEPVSLYDRLVMKPRKGGGGLTPSGGGIPAAENTVTKAALALVRLAGLRLNVEIELQKEIPVAAGLGGGSSDAAAALRLIVSTLGLSVSDVDLAALAFSVGADVPFFLKGGAQLAEGAGEILSSAGRLPDHWIVLASPGFELSAARVYEKFDQMGCGDEEEFTESCRRLKKKVADMENFKHLSEIVKNELEPAAVSICADIDTIKQLLKDVGASSAMMSGSGPSVFGLFPDEKSARAAAGRLRPSVRDAWVLRPVA